VSAKSSSQSHKIGKLMQEEESAFFYPSDRAKPFG
jgi:hypothetical protein